MPLIINIFILTFPFIISNTTYAEVYKWVDENGKVHFSQTPPDNSAEKVEINNNESTVDDVDNRSAKQKEQKYLEYLRQERLDKEENKAKENEKQAKLQARCERKLADYEALQAGGRFYELNERGERIFLSNDQMNEAKKTLKIILDKSCR